MPMRSDMELQRLEAEATRLSAYVGPHELLAGWIRLVGIGVAFGAGVFVLAGWIAGEVDPVNLFWTAILAAMIVYVVTWEFRWEGRFVTIAEVVGLLVRRVVAFPADLADARARLMVCRARIAHLKRSRR